MNSKMIVSGAEITVTTIDDKDYHLIKPLQMPKAR